MAEIVSIYEGLIHKYSTRFFINGYDVDDLKQIARSVIIESISKFDGDHGSEFIFFISSIAYVLSLFLLKKTILL